MSPLVDNFRANMFFPFPSDSPSSLLPFLSSVLLLLLYPETKNHIYLKFNALKSFKPILICLSSTNNHDICLYKQEKLTILVRIYIFYTSIIRIANVIQKGLDIVLQCKEQTFYSLVHLHLNASLSELYTVKLNCI